MIDAAAPPGGGDGGEPRVMLNADGVAAPIHRSVRLAAEAMHVCLPAIAGHDYSAPFRVGPPIYQVAFEPPADPADRSAELEAWLLAQAFGEIARGIRSALEEAYLFAMIATMGPATIVQFQEMATKARADANAWPNPRLLAELGNLWTAPLIFDAELQSLQKARNCLEHRSGIVEARDCDGGEALELVLPRLAILTMIGGEEREIQVGVPVDGGPVWARRDVMRLRFARGERIRLQLDDVAGVFVGSFHLAADIVARLPKPADPAVA